MLILTAVKSLSVSDNTVNGTAWLGGARNFKRFTGRFFVLQGEPDNGTIHKTDKLLSGAQKKFWELNIAD